MKVVWFGSLMVFSLSTLLSPQVFAQSGTSLLGWSAVSVASQEAMLQDSAFKTAVDQVAGLRLSLFDFKKKLDQMDSSTKELHAGEFDAEYKLIRAEMVKVIILRLKLRERSGRSILINKISRKLSMNCKRRENIWKSERSISISFCFWFIKWREKFMTKRANK